jgi:miniconductance mechanosensitive channel
LNLTYFIKLEPWLQAFAGLAVLLALAVVVRFVVVLVFMPVLRRIRSRADSPLTDVVLADAAIRRMAQVLPLVVILMGIEEVPHLSLKLATVMGNVAMAFMVIQVVRSLLAMLDALLLAQHQGVSGDGQTVAMKVRSIKSYVQLGKLILMVAAAIIAAATLFNRSPFIVLSGLGAMSAVLMLVFKDTILSFTAGVLLSSNDMLRLDRNAAGRG